VVKQFAALRLIAFACFQAAVQHVQLRFAHRALESQQKAVIVIARVVHAVGVSQQRPEDRAQFQQLMPIPARSGQPAHLDA
jgi:hypothetical protein